VPRYLFSVHHEDGEVRMTPERQQQAWDDTGAFNEHLERLGALVFAGGLVPVDRAYVVDGRGDPAAVRPGPAIEATRRLGGFWIVEAPDDATAAAWAHEASRACNEPVEVRAFME
jgi:hypothetical protein